MLENTPYSNLQRLAAKKKKEAQRRSRLLRHYRKDLVQVGEADSKARSDLTSKKRPRDSNEEGFVMSKPQKKERAEKRQQSTDDRNDPFRKEKRKAAAKRQSIVSASMKRDESRKQRAKKVTERKKATRSFKQRDSAGRPLIRNSISRILEKLQSGEEGQAKCKDWRKFLHVR